MISVGAGDGRKGLGLGLGFCGVAAEMEDAELEEGEAYGDNSAIDPDIDLSYIDEKIQDVLGHFQKDFEGGVSTDMLGAKYGGYGSFLPTYQRSPVGPRPRTPPKIRSSNTSRSHNNPLLEGGQTNSVVPSSASLLLSKGSTPGIAASTRPSRDSAIDNLKKHEHSLSAYCAEESSSACEIEKNFSQDVERSLRVRIKVGSDNLSTQKNAEIYSGLGLDISPSLSGDESPIGSEGSREPFNSPEESPNSILQIMASFPLSDNLLLSPLSDNLIYLSEKQKGERQIEPKKGKQVSNAKHSDRVKGSRKSKSSRKNGIPLELKNHSNKDSQIRDGLLLKKEKDCVRLPTEGLFEDAVITNKVKRESSDLAKGKIVKAEPTWDIGLFDNPSGNIAAARKIFKEEKGNVLNDMASYPRKDDYSTGELIGDFATVDSNISYSKKAENNEQGYLFELKAIKKSTSLEEDSSASETKKKLKESESQVGHSTEGEAAKESSNVDRSLVPRGSKNAHANVTLPKSELQDSKLQKNLIKARDAYKDIFGDVELEQDINDVDSAEMVSTNRPEDFESAEKCSSKITSKDIEPIEKCASRITSKEKLNGKKRDKSSTPDSFPKADPPAAPVIGSGPISEAVVGTGTLVPLVKEDWVCCDKCQKWRLLPLGTNPKSLPKEWLCSMLNWLPGMNRCSYSEEETTKALVARYQVPAHGGCPGESSSVDASCFDHRKIYGIKDVSAPANQESRPLNPLKNNLQASDNCNSHNGVTHSALVNEIKSQQSSKSAEKHQIKEKENKKLVEQNSGQTRRKREAECGGPGVSKKSKVDSKRGADSVRMRDHDERIGKVGSEKDRQQNDDKLIGDSKRTIDNKSKGFKNTNDQGTGKKRKVRENELLHESDCLEAASENDDKKEKKTKVSKFAGRETSGSKGTSSSKGSGGHKKHRSIKDQQFGTELGSAITRDAVESLKRDLGSVHSQATSSSSKVSDSHKKRTISKEVKGSPVESVSSSPLRFLKDDKSVSVRRSLEGKDDFGNAGLFTTNSLRRCSYGENEEGSDGCGRVRDAETFVDGGQHRMQDSNQYVKEEGNERQFQTNVSRPVKPRKGSSLRSKNKNGTFQAEHGEGELKISNPCDVSVEHVPCDENIEKRRALKNSSQEQLGITIVKQDLVVGKGEAEMLGERGKRESQSQIKGNNRLDDNIDASSLDRKQNLQLDRNEISSKRFPADQLPLSGRRQSENEAPPHSASGSHKENEAKSSLTDSNLGDETLKIPKSTRVPEKQIENQSSKSAYLTPNSHRAKGMDVPSPARRDPSSQAGNSAVKEAKDLKHLADRLKNSGSNAESTSLYFQAALKFLHGASLLESSSSESSKKGEMIMSMQVYSSTAKLCEFCAHEYEKCKDMAAAALAYKLMEVAYMRVIYSSNANASKDRHELQTALQVVSLGESPSSSASDVDNLNHPAALDKVPSAKSVGSPQVTGNYVIGARNRPNLVRMLNFAQDVNYAMEASKKSRNAFAAANSRMKEAQSREGIASVKKALDFSFQDVEGVLRLVRLAMDAINR